MGSQMRKVLLLLGMIIIGMLALTIFSDPLLTSVTNPASQTFSSQQTVASGGSPDLTLTLTGGAHWFTDDTNLTLTGSTSGALPGDVTLDATRTVLTYNVPAGATVSEDVTAAYVTEDTASQSTVAWKLAPLVIVMIALLAIGGSIFIGVQAGRRRNIGLVLMSLIVLFLGVILGEVVGSFTNDAITLYALQPDYTGIGALLPIVDLGYVFAIFGIAIGGAVGYGSTVFRS